MTDIGDTRRPASPRALGGWTSQKHLKWLLVAPLILFFIVFFAIPVGLLFATSFNPAAVGQVAVTLDLTLDNYLRFFQRSNFLMAAGRSVLLATIVSFITLLVSYPMAFVIAKTQNPARNTFLLIPYLRRCSWIW